MIKVNIYPVLIIIAFLSLGGCSDNGFLFRSFGEYKETDNKGIYYIGEPYRIKGVLYTPKEDMSYSERGMAAWYTKSDLNRLTTNGEVFDDSLMTAAHKTLPLPSIVRITNLENGNTAIVRVNDRGPSVNNRLIDVSQKTAAALEFRAGGTTLVQVDILPNESRRLKESLIKQHRMETDSSDSIQSDIIPLGSDTPIYQPNAASVPIYGEEQNQYQITPVVSEEGLPDISETRQANEVSPINNDQPIDLVSPEIDAIEVPAPKAKEIRTESDQEYNKSQQDKGESDTLNQKNENISDLKQEISTFEDGNTSQKSESKAVDFLEETWVIQVGAFGNPDNIKRAKQSLEAIGSIIQENRNGLTAVQLGPFKNKQEAKEILDKVRQAGYPEAQVRQRK